MNRRAHLAALLFAFSIAACDAPAPPPAGTSAPTASGAVAPPGAQVLGSGAAVPSGAVTVQVPPATTAEAGALPSGAAPVAEAPRPAGPPPVDESSAKNGILAAGAADKVLAKGAAPQVKLLSAGATPHEALSYDLSPGTKQSTVMSMDMTMSVAMAGGPGAAPQTMELPQIQMTLELEAGAKDATGDVAVKGKVGDVGVNAKPGPQEQLKASLEPALAGIEGMTISYMISPKGRARDVKVELPKSAPANAKQMMDQMRQSFESMVAPLPEEPVGVGAQWQVLTRISTGADILQWTTYELKKREGTRIELGAVVKQLAANAEIGGGQLPPGMKASISAFRSGGTGASVLDLKSLAPESGTGDVDSSMSLSGSGQSMSIDTKVKIAFGQKK